MKTRVKLFSGNRVGDIETQINEFIDEHKIDVVDIKITMTIHLIACSLVYRTESTK